MHGLKASPVFPQGPWSQGMCREIKPRPEALPNVCGGFKSLLRFINVFIKTDMFSAYRCMPAEGWGEMVSTRHGASVLVECGEKGKGEAVSFIFTENIFTDVGKC